MLLKFLKCKDTKERSVLIDSATRLLKDADKDNINAWQKELREYLDKELSVEEEYSLVHALLMISFTKYVNTWKHALLDEELMVKVFARLLKFLLNHQSASDMIVVAAKGITAFHGQYTELLKSRPDLLSDILQGLDRNRKETTSLDVVRSCVVAFVQLSFISEDSAQDDILSKFENDKVQRPTEVYATLCAYECYIKKFRSTQGLESFIIKVLQCPQFESAALLDLKLCDIIELMLKNDGFTDFKLLVTSLCSAYTLKNNNVKFSIKKILRSILLKNPELAVLAELQSNDDFLPLIIEFCDATNMKLSFGRIISQSLHSLSEHKPDTAVLIKLYKTRPDDFKQELIQYLCALDMNASDYVSLSRLCSYFLNQFDSSEIVNSLLSSNSLHHYVKLIILKSLKKYNEGFLPIVIECCYSYRDDVRLEALCILKENADFGLFEKHFLNALDPHKSGFLGSIKTQTGANILADMFESLLSHPECNKEKALKVLKKNLDVGSTYHNRISTALTILSRLSDLPNDYIPLLMNQLFNSFPSIRDASFQLLLKRRESVFQFEKPLISKKSESCAMYHQNFTIGSCMLGFLYRTASLDELMTNLKDRISIKNNPSDLISLLTDNKRKSNLLSVLTRLKLFIENEPISVDMANEITRLCFESNLVLFQLLAVDTPEGFDVTEQLDLKEDTDNVEKNEIMGLSWRCLKESCLILKELIEKCILDTTNILSIGRHMMHLMFNTRHLGAYSSVEPVLEDICFFLMDKGEQEIVRKWLHEALELIFESDNLLKTRRSGGVSLCILVLLRAYVYKKFNSVLSDCVSRLLDHIDNSEVVVHSINILRHLVRDTSLFYAMEHKLLDRMFHIILHYDKNNWMVANSLHLLFAEISSKLTRGDKIESLAYLKKFKSLFDYMDKLEVKVNNDESFPLMLLLLKKFSASTVEEFETNLISVLFYNLVNNVNVRTRQLCAFNFLNLSSKTQTIQQTMSYFEDRIQRSENLWSLNSFHGILQVIYDAIEDFGFSSKDTCFPYFQNLVRKIYGLLEGDQTRKGFIRGFCLDILYKMKVSSDVKLIPPMNYSYEKRFYSKFVHENTWSKLENLDDCSILEILGSNNNDKQGLFTSDICVKLLCEAKKNKPQIAGLLLRLIAQNIHSLELNPAQQMNLYRTVSELLSGDLNVSAIPFALEVMGHCVTVDSFPVFVEVLQKHSHMRKPVDSRRGACKAAASCISKKEFLDIAEKYPEAFVNFALDVVLLNLVNDDDEAIRKTILAKLSFFCKNYAIVETDVDVAFLEIVKKVVHPSVIQRVKEGLKQKLLEQQERHLPKYDSLFEKEKPNIYIEELLLIRRYDLDTC